MWWRDRDKHPLRTAQAADLSTVETDLEDIFLQLTRRAAGSGA